MVILNNLYFNELFTNVKFVIMFALRFGGNDDSTADESRKLKKQRGRSKTFKIF